MKQSHTQRNSESFFCFDKSNWPDDVHTWNVYPRTLTTWLFGKVPTSLVFLFLLFPGKQINPDMCRRDQYSGMEPNVRSVDSSRCPSQTCALCLQSLSNWTQQLAANSRPIAADCRAGNSLYRNLKFMAIPVFVALNHLGNNSSSLRFIAYTSLSLSVLSCASSSFCDMHATISSDCEKATFLSLSLVSRPSRSAAAESLCNNTSRQTTITLGSHWLSYETFTLCNKTGAWRDLFPSSLPPMSSY